MSGAAERMASNTSRALPHDWDDLVLTYFPNAPASLVEQTLMMVLNDFFRKTLIWTGKSPWIVGDGETTVFPVPSPEPETAVIYVFDAVTRNGVRLHLVPLVADPGPAVLREPENWLRLTSNLEGLVTFDGPPPVGEQIAFTIAMAPSTLRMPEALLREVQTAIVVGVRAWMYDMPFKPWSDREAAATMRRMYATEIGHARVRARRGHLATQLLPRGPDWAGKRWYG